MWLKPLLKVPDKYDPAFFKLLVERLRSSINFLDHTNFPAGIPGTLLNENTIAPIRMTSVVWHIPLIALAEGVYTPSTSLVSFGGFGHWSSFWGANNVELVFQVTGVSGASATATFVLEGAGGVELASVTTDAGVWELLQSDPFSPPLASQTIVVKVKTSSGTQAAGLLNATLLVVPKTQGGE